MPNGYGGPYKYEVMTPYEIEEMDHRLHVAVEALQKISDLDYRGNLPSEQMIARKALNEINKGNK